MGEDDAWVLRAYGIGETARIVDPDITLSVDALYELPPDAASRIRVTPPRGAAARR